MPRWSLMAMMKIVTQKMLVGQGLGGIVDNLGLRAQPPCHPERNANCVKRSSCGVEGPLETIPLQRSRDASHLRTGKVRDGNGGVQLVGVLRLRDGSAARSRPFAQDDKGFNDGIEGYFCNNLKMASLA